jgi:hypothetical protein
VRGRGSSNDLQPDGQSQRTFLSCARIARTSLHLQAPGFEIHRRQTIGHGQKGWRRAAVNETQGCLRSRPYINLSLENRLGFSETEDHGEQAIALPMIFPGESKDGVEAEGQSFFKN